MRIIVTLLVVIAMFTWWHVLHPAEGDGDMNTAHAVTVIPPQYMARPAAVATGIPPHYWCHKDEYGAVMYEPIESGYPPLVIFNCVNCQCGDKPLP